MRARQTRTPEQLRRISMVLQYEVWMFAEMIQELAYGSLPEGSMRNAVLESFAVHTRGIVDFLFPPQSARATDLVADDFFDDPAAWRAHLGAMTPFLSETRTRVGRLVAHLTDERVDIRREDKSWDFIRVGREVVACLRVFVDRVPRDHVDLSLIRIVAAIR